MNLFDLFASISLDTSAFETGIGNARKIAEGFGNIFGKIVSAVWETAKKAASQIVGLAKQAVNQYGEYEQLVGGIETLFKNASDTVLSNAKNAFKTAQMSANQYMNLVTSFSASLIQSLSSSTNVMTEEMIEQEEKSLDNQYSAQKKYYEKAYDLAKQNIDDELEAISKSNSKKLSALQKVHEQELDSYQKLTDNKIALVDKEYNETLKLIDKQAYDRIKAIDNEINKIDEQAEKESKALEASEIATKKAELQKAVDKAKNDKALKKAQTALNTYLEELDRKKVAEERKALKESLNNQKEQIKDEAQAAKENAKTQRDEKVNAIKEESNAQLEAMREAQSKQEEELKEHQSTELKLIKRAKNEQLSTLKESYEDQLTALKESIENQKKALKTGADEMSAIQVTPEIYEQAAKVADRAVIDMADNANKMGTSIDSIMLTYQSLSRGNYAMLDNLKLGYGGTKTELQRLIKDSAKMTDIQEKLGITVDASSLSFGNIVNAISVMQESLGIAGTSLKEGTETIQGSAGSVSAAWENLVTVLATKPEDNIELQGYIEDFVNSAIISLDQMLPAWERAFEGIGQLIEKALPIIFEKIPAFIDKNLPKLLSSGTNMLTALLSGISNNIPAIANTISYFFESFVSFVLLNLPVILKAGMELLYEIGKGLIEALPELLQTAITLIKELANMLTDSEQLDKILDVALELILTLVDGLVNSIEELIEPAMKIIEGLLKYSLKPENLAKIINAALKIVLTIATGLIAAIPQLISGVLQLIQSITDQFTKTDWLKIGKDIVNGLLEGLKKNWDNLTNWFGKGVNGLAESTRNFLGIHSPSKVFAQIGGYMAEGLGVGWNDKIDGIKSDINSELTFNTVGNQRSTAAAGGISNIPPISINIENFVNNTDDDLETLADKLMYIMSDKINRKGVVYS